MSDLTASQCGCNKTNGGGCCNSLIWIILLSCICGNNNDNCGCGMSGNFFGGNGCGCGDNSMIWIILLLCCCNN